MSRGGAGLFLVASVSLLLVGFWQLLRARRWRAVVISIIWIVGYPALIWGLFHFFKGRDGLWIVTPFLLLAPAWVCAGIFVFAASEDYRWSFFQDASLTTSRLRLICGIILLVLSACVWHYGFTHTGLSNKEEAGIAALALYGVLGGFVSLFRFS